MTSAQYRLVHTLLWLLACPWLLFPNLSPILTVVAIGLLVTGRVAGRHWQGYWFRATAIDILLLIYVGLNLMAWLISPLPEVGLSKLTVILLGWAAYYLIQDWLDAPAGFDQLITLLVLSGLGLAAAGLFIVDWPQVQQVIQVGFIYRLLPHLSGSFTVHRNEFAAAMLLLLPFAWVFWRQRRHYLALLPLLVIGFTLLLSQSRTAFLSGAAMGLTGLLWGRFRLRWVMAGLLVAAGLLLWQISNFERVSNFMVMVDSASKSNDPTSWLSRVEIWQVAVNSLRDYPVIGSGLYTFPILSRLNDYYRLIAPDFNVAHAHNLFLQEGVNLGWPGILLAVELWGGGLALLWLVAEKSDDLRPEAILFGATLSGYLAFNWLDVLSPGHRPGLLVWFVLAGGMAGVRFWFRPGWYWQLAPLGLLGLLAMTPLLPYNLANLQLDRVRLGVGEIEPPLTAENLLGNPTRLGWLAYLSGQREVAITYWRQASQAMNYFQAQGFQAHQKHDFATALNDYDFVLELEPSNGLVHYWHGLIDWDQGRPAEALSHFEQAGRYSMDLDNELRAAIFFAQGRALVDQENYPAGIAALHQAIALDDSRAIYYEWLGKGLEAFGDPAGAAAAYEQASQKENTP